MRKENKNTKKTIRYTAANLGIDIFFVLFNIIFLLIIYIKKNCNCVIKSMSGNNNNDTNNNSNKYIVSKNKYKEEIKEVISDNKTSNSNENKIDNINNNIVVPYPNSDEPPVVAS